MNYTSILLEEPEYFLFSPASKVQKAMQEWDSTYPETGYMIQFCFRGEMEKGCNSSSKRLLNFVA